MSRGARWVIIAILLVLTWMVLSRWSIEQPRQRFGSVILAGFMLIVALGLGRRRRALNEQLSVTFDGDVIEVRVLADFDADWNQTARWDELVRVCFVSEGLYQSDVLRLTLRSRPQPVLVLMEAAGAAQLLGEISRRGLFPEDVWRSAMGEASGRAHCWPPLDAPEPP